MKLPRCLVLWMSVIGLSSATNAAVFFEDFEQPPSEADWKIHGDETLFQWNAHGHLDVTWDTTQTNSFFIHPLNSILGKNDDFRIGFELTLHSIGYQSPGGSTDSFEIALGLINTVDATDPNFFRGSGNGVVKNLVEFDYFPDNGFGDTIWPAFWSTNATLNYAGSGDFVLATLPLNKVLVITMDYSASNETLTTTITADGEAFVTDLRQSLSSSFTDFRVDAFAVSSYEFQKETSLHAQGKIDNVRIIYPLPVTKLAVEQINQTWTTTFNGRTNWTYRLEESTDLNSWTATGEEVNGEEAKMELPILRTDPFVFTRVRAARR